DLRRPLALLSFSPLLAQNVFDPTRPVGERDNDLHQLSYARMGQFIYPFDGEGGHNPVAPGMDNADIVGAPASPGLDDVGQASVSHDPAGRCTPVFPCADAHGLLIVVEL